MKQNSRIGYKLDWQKYKPGGALMNLDCLNMKTHLTIKKCTMSQSFIVTFIYGIIENKCMRTRETKCTDLPASNDQWSRDILGLHYM
jgi:hypothetical protein